MLATKASTLAHLDGIGTDCLHLQIRFIEVVSELPPSFGRVTLHPFRIPSSTRVIAGETT